MKVSNHQCPIHDVNTPCRLCLTDRIESLEATLSAIAKLPDEIRAEGAEFEAWARGTSLKNWIEPYADMAKICKEHARKLEALLKARKV